MKRSKILTKLLIEAEDLESLEEVKKMDRHYEFLMIRGQTSFSLRRSAQEALTEAIKKRWPEIHADALEILKASQTKSSV